MKKVLVYHDNELPANIKCQILSFLRIVWHDGFVGKNRLRNWITKKEHHPIHFVMLEENDLVVSYAGVVWKYLKHEGKT